jgi:hypothetical protein
VLIEIYRSKKLEPADVPRLRRWRIVVIRCGGRLPTFDRYEDLQAYLRGFVQFGGDDPPYDFNGTVHLMLALLDNLRANALEAELEDIRGSFTDEQAAFFLKLAEYVRRPESTG